MNFLAHLALSYPKAHLMTGNLIADLHTHSELTKYDDDIRKGVDMHRFIDKCTDSHEHFLKLRRHLRPDFDKWSPVIIDIFHDYVLANEWEKYHTMTFPSFCDLSLDIVANDLHRLHEPAHTFVSTLVNIRWLLTYKQWDGITRAFQRVEIRTKGGLNADKVIEYLKLHQHELSEGFEKFYFDLMAACAEWTNENGE